MKELIDRLASWFHAEKVETEVGYRYKIVQENEDILEIDYNQEHCAYSIRIWHCSGYGADEHYDEEFLGIFYDNSDKEFTSTATFLE